MQSRFVQVRTGSDWFENSWQSSNCELPVRFSNREFLEPELEPSVWFGSFGGERGSQTELGHVYFPSPVMATSSSIGY